LSTHEIESFSNWNHFRNKKQERKDLSHELKHAAHVIKRLTDECNKLMVEKFGKLVQLEKLEGAIVNLQIEELKQKLDDAGDEYYNTMAQYEVWWDFTWESCLCAWFSFERSKKMTIQLIYWRPIRNVWMNWRI